MRIPRLGPAWLSRRAFAAGGLAGFARSALPWQFWQRIVDDVSNDHSLDGDVPDRLRAIAFEWFLPAASTGW